MSSIPTLSPSLVTDLRTAVSGAVLAPDDDAYDAARTVWNGRVDRFPAVVVRVASTDDVAAAVAFAREQGVPLAVRGGGHHVTGSAVADSALVVDLSTLTDVAVDPAARTVRAGAGCRVGDVLGATQEHGLAFAAGSASQNGLAGSTLGGAIGWARRAHGLGVDSLRSVDLVTVDGEVLTASESEHPELFWAVRGAGANVGIVTSFEFDCFALGPEVAVTQVAYPAPDAAAAAALFRQYRDYCADAPREVSSMAMYGHVPPLPFVPAELHGEPMVMVFAVYAGDPGDGEATLAPLGEFGPVMLDLSERRPFVAVHEMAREMFPDGLRYSWHSLYATALDDDLLGRAAAQATAAPGPESGLTLWHLGGAIADVPADATAYAWRDAEFLVSIEAQWRDPTEDAAQLAWAEAAWTDLREADATVEGFYPGFPGFVSGEERGRMAYGANYDRLADVKARYDPENLLSNNLNVTPARVAR